MLLLFVFLHIVRVIKSVKNLFILEKNHVARKKVFKNFGHENKLSNFAEIKEHEDSDVKASGFFYFLCFKQLLY